MDKGIISHIANQFRTYPKKVFLLENTDGFFFRDDVIIAFRKLGFEIKNGTNIKQRIAYELRDDDSFLILVSRSKSSCLEDIKRNSIELKLDLGDFLKSYDIPSIIDLDLSIINELFDIQPFVPLNRRETIDFIGNLNKSSTKESSFDVEDFMKKLKPFLKEEKINWTVVSRIIAEAMLKNIKTPQFLDLYEKINQINEIFQKTLQDNYHQTKSSSAVKRPKIVTKILDHLHFNYRKDKIALLVIDGLALWQYELLKPKLPGVKVEEVIYSWLPSITQLSRQAIFRSGIPHSDYRQGPANEEKLWELFWKDKNFSDFEIAYHHGSVDISRISSVTKLAIVLNDLDEKMHDSTDYSDLLDLTENWIERSKISKLIKDLISKDFIVFLTSDHGNVQAKGWRGLRGREKLGTNKSGSRSERHIEYSKQWLSDEFFENNPGIENSVLIEGQSIYFKNDLSFSNKESLVTHGGAHILEVLIPFVKISNE